MSSQIVVIEPFRYLPTGPLQLLDINSNFSDADWITAALPDFQKNKINLAESGIVFTSNPDGDFDIGPTDIVYFSQTTVPLNNNADSEFRFPRGLLNSIDKSKVTGVRFKIVATATCTFKVAAIRLIQQNWVYAPIDIDTVNERLEYPVSLTGDPNLDSAFPETVIDSEPPEFPIVWRSSSISSIHDPQPVDTNGSVFFRSGSLTETVETESDLIANEIALYFREKSADYYTQLDLNSGFTQEDLNALGFQPDFGESLYESRLQSDLEVLTQDDLNRATQGELERLQDDFSFSWIRAHLQWTDTSAYLSLKDSEGNGYSFNDFEIEPNKYYVAFFKVEENTMAFTIYGSDHLGTINYKNVVFDTGNILDDGFVKRHKGRFGWYAKLLDGDAFVENIRMRGVSHGEYRSHAFNSLTPVVGGKITMDGTLNRDLYNGIKAAPWGGKVSLDTAKSTSKEAVKVQIVPGTSLQGATTNPVYLDDFDNTTLKFRLWYPSSSIRLGAKLEIFLLGENIRVNTLKLPKFIPDQWNDISIDLSSLGKRIQTGPYSIAWIQTLSTVDTTFWIDQVHINARMVSWSGRGSRGDAFKLNVPSWTPMKDTVNEEFGGTVFADRGPEFQVRAQARQYDARISSIKSQPKYAELGRFVWSEDKILPSSPTASFSSSIDQKKVLFDGTGSTDPKRIVIWEWSFDDGTQDVGRKVSHTYNKAGTYTVTLTVTNVQGIKNSITQTIVIV